MVSEYRDNVEDNRDLELSYYFKLDLLAYDLINIVKSLPKI